MSGWNPTPSTEPSGLSTATSYAWYNWKPESPNSPVLKPIITEHPAAKLLEYYGPETFLSLEVGCYFIYSLWVFSMS